MTSPYTTQPLDALMAAQTSVGLVLGALVWLRRSRLWMASVLLVIAIFLVVIAPVSGEFLAGIGLTVAPDHLQHTLKIAAAAATLSALLTRRPFLVGVAALGEVALWRLTSYLQESDAELTAAHLAFFGLLVGIELRTLPRRPQAPSEPAIEPLDRAWTEDGIAFVLGTTAGAVTCRLLLHGWTNSGDEWANTYQAALFAKLHAYGSVTRCYDAFHAFWVFPYMGRTFSQYTPGWPLFMAPFVLLRAIWLAGPASLGLLAAGVSRLARRAAAGSTRGSDPRSWTEVRTAGRFAVGSLLLSSTVLINGGSRYPHIFVAAMFAWSVEALLAIDEPELSAKRQWGWGLVLGACAGLLLAARPGDGAALGIGLLFYFAYALGRRGIGWRAALAAAGGFAALSALTLVILRLQLGKWFATGYSLTTTIYPWVDFTWARPQAGDFKYALPLATGAYCWWPCAPALALAGIGALEGRARRIGFIFVGAYVPFFALYSMLSMARGFDLGYGPRYTLPCVVPMAVGSGLVLARLWMAARSRSIDASALQVGGPAAIALAAVLLGVVRIAPLVYPITYADVQIHNRLHEAIKPLGLHNAVVFGGTGLNNTDPADMTENLPLDLYPDQDVLIAVDRGPEVVRCVRQLYPGRSFYRALPGAHVQIVGL